MIVEEFRTRRDGNSIGTESYLERAMGIELIAESLSPIESIDLTPPPNAIVLQIMPVLMPSCITCGPHAS